MYGGPGVCIYMYIYGEAGVCTYIGGGRCCTYTDGGPGLGRQVCTLTGHVLEGSKNASRFRDQTRSQISPKKRATPQGNSQLGSNCSNTENPGVHAHRTHARRVLRRFLSLSHTRALSFTHTHALSPSHTHTHTHALSLSLSTTHTLSLSHTHTLSLSHGRCARSRGTHATSAPSHSLRTGSTSCPGGVT